MITLDTNVVIRLFEHDDATQGALSNALFERLTPEHPGLIPRECIIELAWVLTRCYCYSRTRLAAVMRTLLSRRELHIENAQRVAWATDQYQHSSFDFADLMILSAAKDHGAIPVKTFDTRFSRHEAVSLLRTH